MAQCNKARSPFIAGFESTKHQNKVKKLKKKKHRNTQHRLFTVSSKPVDWDELLKGVPLGQMGTIVASTPTKSHIMQSAGVYPSQSRVYIPYETHNAVYNKLVRSSELNELIEEHHELVCGCKQFIIHNIRHSDEYRLSCRNLDLLEFQLAMVDGTDDIFNGKRINDA